MNWKDKLSQPIITYIFKDITPEQAWERIDRNHRRDINGAEKIASHPIKGRDWEWGPGLSCFESNSEEDRKKTYELYLKNMKRVGGIPHPYSVMNRGNAELWVVYDIKKTFPYSDWREGATFVGGILYLRNFSSWSYSSGGRDRVTSFLCGINKDYEKTGVYSWMLWDRIQRALIFDDIFDFGSNRVGTGVDEFKKKWGATPQKVGRIKRIKDLMIKILRL